MKGHCILSHGFESGPGASKITALEAVAAAQGWTCERPDYTDLDARRDISALGDVPARLQRLQALAKAASARGPLVLVGSSLGAYISARVTFDVQAIGLFLLAPPMQMGPMPDCDAADVPTAIVHGWNDELIAPEGVIAWARQRRARLSLVDDNHRLSASVDMIAGQFGEWLSALAA